MIMIDVTYSRIPTTEVYKGDIRVAEVDQRKVPRNYFHETEKSKVSFSGWKMEKIIEQLHQLLKANPEAKVTMLRPPPPEKASQDPTAHELDNKTRDILRDDLEQAQEMFKPIHRTVVVGRPRLRVQAQEN